MRLQCVSKILTARRMLKKTSLTAKVNCWNNSFQNIYIFILIRFGSDILKIVAVSIFLNNAFFSFLLGGEMGKLSLKHPTLRRKAL